MRDAFDPFTLTAHETNGPPHGRATSPRFAGPDCRTVLLVDASRTSRRATRQTFEQTTRWRILEAIDRIEVGAHLSCDVPDLVFIDVGSRLLDGRAIVLEIRRREQTVPILLCAAENDLTRAIECLLAGANNIVVRPFTAENLQERIDHTVAKVVATESVRRPAMDRASSSEHRPTA